MKTFQTTLTLIAAACAMATAQAQHFTSHEDAADVPELLFALAETGSPSASSSTASQRMGPWGFDLSGRDLAVKPGDDFFEWANGAWEARTQIPADRTRDGNFDALRALTDDRVREILNVEALAKSKDKDAVKISAAWRSFLDEAAVEELDAAPIAPAMAEICRAQTLADMTRLMGQRQCLS